MSGAHVSHKQPQHVSLRLLVIVTTIVFLVVAAAAGFFAMQFFALKSNSNVDKEITERVISAVDKLYVLPEGEPIVVKVENKDQLNSQAFFSQAQNGDFVLVYAEAKLALLYREGLNKLVNVRPITIDEGENKATSVIPDETKTIGE